MIVFTMILAIFTIFLVLTSRKQLKIAKEVSIRQLRAYVLPKNFNARNVALDPPAHAITPTEIAIGPWLYNKTEGPNVTVIIKNSGQTPAYNLITGGRIVYDKFPDPEDDFYEIDYASSASISILAPGDEIFQNQIIPIPFTKVEMTDLQSGKTAIYIYGKILYIDAFGKKRFTNVNALLIVTY